MDKEGTNTWRYAKAGAKVIVAISPEEVAIIKKTELALNELDQITSLIENEKLDIVFIEGFHSLVAKRKDVAKIITAKDQEGSAETLEGTVEPILAMTGIVAKDCYRRQPTRRFPVVKVPEEGQKLVDIGQKTIEKKKAKKAHTEETAWLNGLHSYWQEEKPAGSNQRAKTGRIKRLQNSTENPF